jgi:hypothetical protein
VDCVGDHVGEVVELERALVRDDGVGRRRCAEPAGDDVLVRAAREVAEPVKTACDVDEAPSGASVVGQCRSRDAGLGRIACRDVASATLGEGVQPLADVFVTLLFDILEQCGDNITLAGQSLQAPVRPAPHPRTPR